MRGNGAHGAPLPPRASFDSGVSARGHVVDGLLSKIADQIDLFVSKEAHFLAVDADNAPNLLVFDHRDEQQTADATQLGAGYDERMTVFVGVKLPNITDLRDLLRLEYARESRAGAWVNHITLKPVSEGGWHIGIRNHAEHAIQVKQQTAKIGFAKPQRVVQHRCENRVELSGRRTDGVEHL